MILNNKIAKNCATPNVFYSFKDINHAKNKATRTLKVNLE